MARITGQRIHSPTSRPGPGGPIWTFKVTYTAVFTDQDLNHEFEDAAKLWEDDSGEIFGGDDDAITAYPIPVRFTPTTSTVEREHIITLPRSQVATEVDAEEIKAQIWLRRVGDAAAADEKMTGWIAVDA